MRQCMQFNTLNTLDHGKQVAAFYFDLVSHIKNGSPLKFAWSDLPDWASHPAIIDHQMDFDMCQRYQTYHDCGKPFCLTIDADGKRHFPDHAQVSKKIWLDYGGDPLEAELMGKDMDLHLLKAEDTAQWAASNRELGPTLLLTAWSEIHANAVMFGGLDSESFKIKAKRLRQRAKAIMGLWCQR